MVAPPAAEPQVLPLSETHHVPNFLRFGEILLDRVGVRPGRPKRVDGRAWKSGVIYSSPEPLPVFTPVRHDAFGGKEAAANKLPQAVSL